MRLFLFSALLIHAVSSSGQEKHALLIGIGNYDYNKTGWKPLSSVRDVTMLKQSLISAQQFQENHIYIITDAQATKTGIVKSLERLRDSADKGDVVFIHVSSHGIQLQDDGSDEIDRFDEAIVPIDAIAPKRRTDPEYEKKEKMYVRDDLFGKLVEDIRKKLGSKGSVVVTMDLCHSGTGHKGGDNTSTVARGLSFPLVSTSFNEPARQAGENLKEFRDSYTASKGDAADLARYVVFSAGRAEEAVYEVTNDKGENMGPLSYALCKTFEKLPENTTYRTFFSILESVMFSNSLRQHPVVEGNGIDNIFWSGVYVRQRPYFRIKVSNSNAVITSDKITLDAGKMAGLDEHAKVAVYLTGQQPLIDTPLTRGVVVTSSSFTSEVKLNSKLNRRPADVVFYLTEPVYNVKPIVLAIGHSSRQPDLPGTLKFTSEEVAGIKKTVSEIKLIRFIGTPELRLIKGSGKDSLFVVKDNSFFSESTPATLADTLKKYIKYKFLKELQVQDEAIHVEVKLVPYRNGKPILDEKTEQVEKGNSYYIGDSVVVVVTNNGMLPVYINLIDLQPNGQIYSIFPNRESGITAEELIVDGKKTVVFDGRINKNPNMILTMGGPTGTEIVKVFASREKIDMEYLAGSIDGGSKNYKSALDNVFGEVNNLGAKSVRTASGSGSVTNIQFRILERK